MYYDSCLKAACRELHDDWFEALKSNVYDGCLAEWVSTFHPAKMPCKHVKYFNGSYNWACKVKFEDGTAWLVRFPRFGQVNGMCVDEKVAAEVSTIDLIRRETTIPVPDIKAWGYRHQNVLGLGAFIIMEFIDGLSLDNVLSQDDSRRLLAEDVSDKEVEFIYRQFSNFVLQLWKLNFDRIGSLPAPDEKSNRSFRPLTMKSHDILQSGGVDTFSSRVLGFSSTTEYFHYLAEQEFKQLDERLSSVWTRSEGRQMFRACKVLASLAPHLVHTKHDFGKFKLVCDDLGLANLMVRSRQDLTIIGVVDLEWSYAGPAQLLACAPWWLLMDRPVGRSWDYDTEEMPHLRNRYLKYLNIYKRVLKEEESHVLGSNNTDFSELVEWTERSGAMWFHILAVTGFDCPDSFALNMLKSRIGWQQWERREAEVDPKEMKAFVDKKMRDLREYARRLNKLERDEERLKAKEITNWEFMEMHDGGVEDIKNVSWATRSVDQA